jgi:CRP-like cAMP-binding protein
VIDALGIRGALVAVGGFLPLLTLLTWARVRVLDAGAGVSAERVDLLKSLPLFRPMPIATIEYLASRLEEQDVAPGEVVIRQGDVGDRFYVIGDGEFTVVQNDHPGPTLHSGDFFGEIALLRDCARTATIVANGSPGHLYSLTREDFVPAVRVELLKSLPLFRPLPPPTIEFLASRLERHEVDAGEVVIRQGEPGDRFYVVGDGRFTVLLEGEPGPSLGPGDFFGEIALLRDVPRTATVVADEPGVLYSLTRDDFVPAVTGCIPSNAAADEVVGARLAQLSRPAAMRV